MGFGYVMGDEWVLKVINGMVSEVRNCIYHGSTS